MNSFDVLSQTYSAAIRTQICSDSFHTSFFHPQHENPLTTKASYHNVHVQQHLDLAQIPSFAGSGNSENCVLVVENVDLKWCVTLGLAFGIDHTFFVEHASNPPGNTPWEAVIGDWSGDRRKPSENGRVPTSSANQADVAEAPRDRWHVDGVLEYKPVNNGQDINSELASTNFVHRMTSYSKDFGWSAGTRVSFILVKRHLCMS
jgi:hypothetical protein